MKPVFLFPSVIVVMLVIKHIINKADPKKGIQKSILELESEANLTRRQDISNLPYIRIPDDTLPFGRLTPVTADEQAVVKLRDQKILNLTGISNTQLKLQYGPANLDALSAYDDNFALLIRSLNNWAVACNEAKMYPEAKAILEYSVNIGSDIRKTYQMLADQYYAELDTDALSLLRDKAAALPEITSHSILDYIDNLL